MGEIEIWKDIPGYEGIYQASNLGNLKRLEGIKRACFNSIAKIPEYLLTFNKTTKNNAYYRVCIIENNKYKTRMVHRLIAKTFLRDYSDKLTVNHIDHNKLNNSLTNLEMCTVRENVSQFHKIKSKYTGTTLSGNKRKWIAQIYLNGKAKNLGTFKTRKKAKEIYDKALQEHLNKGGK